MTLISLFLLSYLISNAIGGDTVSAWTFFGPDSKVWVRATTPEKHCPTLVVDSQPVQMRNRNTSMNGSFPVTVCEAEISPTAKKALVNGEPIPVANLSPKKIVILGDTGCVIKQSKNKMKIQNCNDPGQWPFARVAESAANWHPDLVIHVGDYHYREFDCPDSDPRCKNSVSGDRWASWQQDFFGPASHLLKAAPWVITRGNHERCSRAGEGWFRLLEPRTSPEKCTDIRDPYRVKFEGLSLWVIDSADDNNIQGSLTQISKLFQAGEWIVGHRPFLTPGADYEATVQSRLPIELQEAGKVGIVLAGHQHRLSINQFNDSRPPEIISGNGGTDLDPIEGATTRLTHSKRGNLNSISFADFGFVTLEHRGDSWLFSVRDTFGKEIVQCSLKQEKGQKTHLFCEPAHGEPLSELTTS
jgi:hypothetical protein